MRLTWKWSTHFFTLYVVTTLVTARMMIFPNFHILNTCSMQVQKDGRVLAIKSECMEGLGMRLASGVEPYNW